jgi:hypothetical protein
MSKRQTKASHPKRQAGTSATKCEVMKEEIDFPETRNRKEITS